MISLALQWRQEEHDRLFHGVIYTLDKQHRLTHLVLHLAKYNGKVFSAEEKSQDDVVLATSVDAIIILISTANALNMRLSVPVDQLSRDGFSPIVITTGRLCKLLEGLDHIEDVKFRHEFEANVRKLYGYWLDVFARYHNPLPYLVPLVVERLQQVERKSLFYQQIIKQHPWLTASQVGD